jgi:hypothetical protein
MSETQTINFNMPGWEGFSVAPIPEVDPQEQYEYDQRQKRKAESIAYCGAYLTGINPETLTRYKFAFKCGYWRECDSCFEVRVQKFVTRADKAQVDAGINFRVAIVTNAQASKMTRKLKKLNYWRIPLDESTVVLLYDSFVAEKFRNIPELVDVEGLDWNDIAMTPEGKKYTGDLGRREEKEPEEAVSFKMTYPLVEGLEDDDEAKLWADSVTECRSLNPGYDAGELSYATWRLVTTFKEKVLEKDGKIPYEVDRYVRVRKEYFCSWVTGELVYKPESDKSLLPIHSPTLPKSEVLTTAGGMIDVAGMIEAAQAKKVLSEAEKAIEELFGF